MALPPLKTSPAATQPACTADDHRHSIAARLERFAGDDVQLLHHRSADGLPGSGLDHLAVGPSGVFVIGARHCPGGRVEVRSRGGLLGPARHRLLVRGRDRSALVRLLARQRTAVAEVLGDPEIPVLAVLCAVGAQLPWNRVPVVEGVTVRGVVDTCLMVRASGPYDAEARALIHAALRDAFPAMAS